MEGKDHRSAGEAVEGPWSVMSFPVREGFTASRWNGYGVKVQRIKIMALYIVLGAGGLWHVLGVFQAAMRNLASAMVIGLALWLFGEVARGLSPHQRRPFILWCSLVFVVSIGMEWLGIVTGRIFGSYSYGDVLWPSVDRVPIAIGCAWVGILLSSGAVAQRISRTPWTERTVALALLISLLMVVFDVLMESAAVKLGYWRWLGNRVPWQNYLAWFLLGVAFSYPGVRMGIWSRKVPPLVFHAYMAQLLYFGLVHIAY